MLGHHALFACARDHLCTVVCAGTLLPVELRELVPSVGESGIVPTASRTITAVRNARSRPPAL